MEPNLTKKSLQFEKLVARILRLIGERDDIVIHDHNISDPETGSSRQVDVLVERNGIRVFVECRDYSRPQDVTWVETLIGRKESLRCDLIIGVSSSGFHKTAIMKAEAKGVILRSVGEVTDTEIKAWGESWFFQLGMINYSKLHIHLHSNRYIDNSLMARKYQKASFQKILADIIFSVSQKLESELENNTANDFSVEVFERNGQPLFSHLGVHTSKIEGFGALVFETLELATNVQISEVKNKIDDEFSGVVFEKDGIAMARSLSQSSMVITLNGIRTPRHHCWTGKIKTINQSTLPISNIRIIGDTFNPVNVTDIDVKVTCPPK
jgi:hypothetical protein